MDNRLTQAYTITSQLTFDNQITPAVRLNASRCATNHAGAGRDNWLTVAKPQAQVFLLTEYDNHTDVHKKDFILQQLCSDEERKRDNDVWIGPTLYSSKQQHTSQCTVCGLGHSPEVGEQGLEKIFHFGSFLTEIFLSNTYFIKFFTSDHFFFFFFPSQKQTPHECVFIFNISDHSSSFWNEEFTCYMDLPIIENCYLNA